MPTPITVNNYLYGNTQLQSNVYAGGIITSAASLTTRGALTFEPLASPTTLQLGVPLEYTIYLLTINAGFNLRTGVLTPGTVTVTSGSYSKTKNVNSFTDATDLNFGNQWAVPYCGTFFVPVAATGTITITLSGLDIRGASTVDVLGLC